MKKYVLLFLVISAFSCSEKPKDLTVKTNIKGLKKGVVYLQRVIDTTMVTVDSVIVNGESQFELYSELEEPDLFYLLLDKKSKIEDRISFFTDKGTVEINSTVKYFVADAEIKASKHQELLEEYQKLMDRLKNRNLDLIKESFEAQKNGDTALFVKIQKQQDNLIKNRYFQTVNFALNNPDSEISPYLALSEIYDVNTKLLDTIYTSLTPKIKASKYGKQLEDYITERKNDK
ncbi:MAG: DUF4369 domain-containing protein [Jejuia sp.]